MEKIQQFIENSIAKECNHIEFILTLVSNSLPFMTSFNTSISKDDFYKYMSKLMSKRYKYHQKVYKEIVIGNTYYHNHKNEDIYVYNLQTVDVETIHSNLMAHGSIKNKLTILSVPSTKFIHCQRHIKKLSFYITNRITVNFINGIELTPFYNITITYNHDKNVDIQHTIKNIQDIIQLMELV